MAPATAPVWLEAQLKVIQEHKEPRLGVQWLRSGGSQSQAGKPAPLDRFSLRVPYCLGALLWEVVLNAEEPRRAPDFVQAEGETSLLIPADDSKEAVSASAEIARRLREWNPFCETALLDLVLALRAEHARRQIARAHALNDPRIMFELSTLGVRTVEIQMVGPDRPGMAPSSVHMALPLTPDLSCALREGRPRPQGPLTARLEVVFDLQGSGAASGAGAGASSSASSSSSAPAASGGGARAQQPRLAMAPEIEAELGNCSTSGGGSFVPKWTEGSSCLVEYAFAVEEALEARARDVVVRRATQPEPSAGLGLGMGMGMAGLGGAGGWRDVVAGAPAAVGAGGGALSQTVGTAVGALGSLASAGAAAVATAMQRSGVMVGGGGGVSAGSVPGAKEYERRAAFIEALGNALGRPLEVELVCLSRALFLLSRQGMPFLLQVVLPQDFPLVAPVLELTASGFGDASSALPPPMRSALAPPPAPGLSRRDEMALQAAYQGPQWNPRWSAEDAAQEVRRWLASEEAAHFAAPPVGRAPGGGAGAEPGAPTARASSGRMAALQAAAAAGGGGAAGTD